MAYHYRCKDNKNIDNPIIRKSKNNYPKQAGGNYSANHVGIMRCKRGIIESP